MKSRQIQYIRMLYIYIYEVQMGRKKQKLPKKIEVSFDLYEM